MGHRKEGAREIERRDEDEGGRSVSGGGRT